MTNSKRTKVFLVLNEETMQIEKQTIGFNNGFNMHQEPKMFETEKEANEWAAGQLEIWDVVKSHFEHNWIEHRQNTKPEIISVEKKGQIKGNLLPLKVRIRFSKWILTFDWQINLITNFVHANDEALGLEIEEAITRKDVQVLLEFFEFDHSIFAKEIEDRKHPIQ
tara:strand:- start:1079 stop:1576 length:498 start_codon:yes stop_codon:yes gene_type:complete